MSELDKTTRTRSERRRRIIVGLEATLGILTVSGVLAAGIMQHGKNAIKPLHRGQPAPISAQQAARHLQARLNDTATGRNAKVRLDPTEAIVYNNPPDHALTCPVWLSDGYDATVSFHRGQAIVRAVRRFTDNPITSHGNPVRDPLYSDQTVGTTIHVTSSTQGDYLAEGAEFGSSSNTK